MSLRPKTHTDMFCRLVTAWTGRTCVAELRFHPARRWRFDYAIPELKIALEVEGGIYTGGRHTRPKGFLGDIEKYNTAATMGWMLLRTTPSQLFTSATKQWLDKAIEYRKS